MKRPEYPLITEIREDDILETIKRLIAPPHGGGKEGREMKTKKEYIAEVKENHPILETSGSGTGTYKYQKYLDGIDLRYGFNTRKAAEMDRAKVAMEAWQFYEYQERKVPCPKCGKETTQGILDQMSKCWECEKQHPFYDTVNI